MDARGPAPITDDPDRDADQHDDAPRLPYDTPELTRLGSVAELTEKLGIIPDGGGAGSFIP